MVRLAAALSAALLLAACGAQPQPLGAPRPAVEQDAFAHENVFASKDIRYVCERMIAKQAEAKANKTNVARMGTALDHVQSLADEQQLAKVEAIATKALAEYHTQCLKQKGANLSAKEAEAMKATLMKGFKDCLAALPKPAEKPE